MNKWMIAIFLLCLAGLFAPFIKSHDAQFYFSQGSKNMTAADASHPWVYRWDLSCALANFNHAIKLNPKFVAAYSSRAVAESLKGNLEDAIRDYTSAIELNPQDTNSYLARADVETTKHDFDYALADYEKVIALKPDDRAAYRGRINVMEMQNNLTGAMVERVRMIEEFVSTRTNGDSFLMRNPARLRERLLPQLDRALNADTNFAWGYYYRGVIKCLTNDWPGALADFQRCENFSDIRLKDYAAIHIWLVQMQAGEKEKADDGLLAYCQNHASGTSDDWPMHIVKFLLNQTSEADLSGAIDPSDAGRQQSEFWYYAGMKRLLAGDKTGAGDCFQKSLATKARPYAVSLSASAELNSISTEAAAK